jgi:hypothetical protein
MLHIWGRGEVRTGFCRETREKKKSLRTLVQRWEGNTKVDF